MFNLYVKNVFEYDFSFYDTVEMVFIHKNKILLTYKLKIIIFNAYIIYKYFYFVTKEKNKLILWSHSWGLGVFIQNIFTKEN